MVYVAVMAALRTSSGSFTVSLLLSAALLVGCALVVSRLKDPAPATARPAAVEAPAPLAQPALEELSATTRAPLGSD